MKTDPQLHKMMVLERMFHRQQKKELTTPPSSAIHNNVGAKPETIQK